MANDAYDNAQTDSEMLDRAEFSYARIATNTKLDLYTTSRFIRYMRARWPNEEILHCYSGYAMEWAQRFKYGMEYGTSDGFGRAILDKMKMNTCMDCSMHVLYPNDVPGDIAEKYWMYCPAHAEDHKRMDELAASADA